MEKRKVMEKRSKTYVVNLNPQPWKRAGLNGKKFFDQQKQDKIAFGLYLLQQHNNEPLFSGAIEVNITFFMPIPPGKKKHIKPGTYHKTVPDNDNLEKFILDAAKNVCYTDDRIISVSTHKKIYDNNPRVEMTITSLE